MLPRVIVHNQVSVDGRNDGFAPDMALHYEIAATWNMDAHLAGSGTILNAPGDVPPEDDGAFKPPECNPDDPRPLLVIPDSRGRVSIWHYLRKQPYWRGMVSLCSDATPKAHLEYLRARHVDSIVAGDDHVDLRAALEELNARYGVQTVVADSGGTLNGVLLRAGLVHEVSLLVSPCLVGGTIPRSIFRAPDLTSAEGVVPLTLTHVEQVKGDFLWLRYNVSAVPG